MNVLVTNDDGIFSRGIEALVRALESAGHEVFVVAPLTQQSGVGQSLSVFEPLRSKEVRHGALSGMGIYGTPADCVKVALGCLMKRKPDLVISGINEGPNVGPDINYSGTIGAAAEGALAGVPSMAVSHASHGGTEEIDDVATHSVRLAEKIDWKSLQTRLVINVNYPDIPLRDARGPVACPQSMASWDNVYRECADPRDKPYWWLEGSINPPPEGGEGDRELLFKGYITVTPLKFDYTDYKELKVLKNMAIFN